MEAARPRKRKAGGRLAGERGWRERAPAEELAGPEPAPTGDGGREWAPAGPDGPERTPAVDGGRERVPAVDGGRERVPAGHGGRERRLASARRRRAMIVTALPAVMVDGVLWVADPGA